MKFSTLISFWMSNWYREAIISPYILHSSLWYRIIYDPFNFTHIKFEKWDKNVFSFVEDKLVYYKLFLALGSHIDDDVIVQGKIEDGTRDTLED